MAKPILTYKFRLKDSAHRNLLTKKANAVNYVWNFCNETSKKSASGIFLFR